MQRVERFYRQSQSGVRRARRLSTLSSQLSTRSAFTLVEMLVATALVVLMMLLFADIFSAAIETMSNQRSLANNDQKARVVTTTLRSDLQRMTTRQPLSGEVRGIVPLAPGDAPDARQRGFFYLSENDPFDATDDVLHFTVDLGETLRDPTVSNPSRRPYFGRAQGLGPGNRNQPDWDDGQFGNTSGASRAAEIVYFLRNGNLYRRVLLLRDPLPSGSPPFDTQPSRGPSGTGGPFGVFEDPYPLSRTFYNDWDYSGTRVLVADDGNGAPDPEGTDDYRFHFHGLESLNNDLGRTNVPLAIPQNRFAFHPSDGRPREYLFNAGGNVVGYIGRFTQEETSHPAFVWPGVEPDPVIAASTDNVMTTRDLTLSGDGVVDFGGTLLSGPRTAEDLLLTRVEAFDAEVWDTGYREPPDGSNNNGQFDPFVPDEDLNGNGVRDIGAWVQLGNNQAPAGPGSSPGVFALGNRANPGYGPFPNDNGGPPPPAQASAARNRVFDTWHPAAGRDYDGIDDDGDGSLLDGDERQPPYRPLLRTAATVSVAGMGPTWSAPPNPQPKMGNTPADVYFPGNGSIGFRVIAASGPTGSRQPEWPRTPGAIVQDGGVIWQAFDNRIGLEKIRITVRFRDVTTDAPRQLTLIHSFVE